MGRWNWVGRRGRRAAIVLAASVSCASVSCSTGPVVTESPRTIQIQQTWQLQPGDSVGNYQIAAGLGDISIELEWGKGVRSLRWSSTAECQRLCVVFQSGCPRLSVSSMWSTAATSGSSQARNCDWFRTVFALRYVEEIAGRHLDYC